MQRNAITKTLGLTRDNLAMPGMADYFPSRFLRDSRRVAGWADSVYIYANLTLNPARCSEMQTGIGLTGYTNISSSLEGAMPDIGITRF